MFKLYDHVITGPADDSPTGIIIKLETNNATVLIDGDTKQVLIPFSMLRRPDYRMEKYEVGGVGFDTEGKALAYRQKLTFLTLLENHLDVDLGPSVDAMKLVNFITDNQKLVESLFDPKEEEPQELPPHILLNAHEIQCGHSRVYWAEGLISQLPEDHDGRNSWLLNHGIRDESIDKRIKRDVGWDEDTQSAELSSGPGK